MSLTLLIRAHMNSIYELSDSGFTKSNFGVNTNTTLSVNTPRGVLGGSVAGVDPAAGDYIAVPCDDEQGNIKAVGLFVNDAAGAAFENSPAIASGKVTVTKGLPTIEIDVFETRDAADSADLVYAVGDLLFSSAQGFVSNEDAGGQTVLGICTKAPSVASPVIGLDMRI